MKLHVLTGEAHALLNPSATTYHVICPTFPKSPTLLHFHNQIPDMKPLNHLWRSPALLAIALALFSLCQSSAAIITSDTVIAPDNFDYEHADIIVSNATLTVDGPHTFASLLVGANGVVTHSFSASGTITTNLSIADEPQILVGTNGVPLVNLNVILASVVVKDLSGTITYQINLDYVVRSTVTNTFLSRNETSAIPDGAMVLVGYALPGGTIPAGLNLTVTGQVEVAVGGIINADGRGFGGNSGTGNGGETGTTLTGAGAGHGGYGGLSSSNASGGNSYGVSDQPVALGSGGGLGVGGVGGAGGGAIRLMIGGSAHIDGVISANGQNAMLSRSGGGSGGSIWITAQTISGTGTITAHGGNGEPIHGGGGGGGRIAIYSDTNSFSGTLAAYGGLGWKAGGAGTIYLKPTDTGLLLVDNGGRLGTNTIASLSGTPDVIIRGGAGLVSSSSFIARDVLVASNSTLTAFGANSTLTLTARNLTVEPTAVIQADGKGSTANITGFAGIYSGGGHAGAGGNSTTNGSGGIGNDGGSIQFTPTSLGRNGGGTNTTAGSGGGLGGGAIRLNISDNLIVNGRISSSGLDSVPAGGGSGGSIWITTSEIAGSGVISVNGGNGNFTLGGGGGGGRIALYVTTTNQFTGAITAYGGGGANRGGAGTIYLDIMGLAGPLLREFILDNGGFAAPNARTNTGISTFTLPTALTIRNGGAGQATSVLNVSSAFVGPDSSLVLPSQMTVTGNVLIAAGGSIHVDGAGFGGNGPGASVLISQGVYYGGGGGHGGYGGQGGTNNARGGNSSGSAIFPTTSGSPGAGSGSSFSPFGGTGGGVLRLTVNGALTNHGRISSNGRTGSGNFAGGGAGGSVVLSAGTLYGAGLISANGGPGILPGGGGGGGGRIAISFNSNFFTGNVTAYGGSGANYGGAGTIYLRTNQFNAGQLIVDNGGNHGTNTTANETSYFGDLTVSGGGKMIMSFPGTGPRHVLIKTNGTLLTPVSANQQFLTLSGNLTIDAGGWFSLDGRGHGAGAGMGRGFSDGVLRGGASHGGFGALNFNSNFGIAYGSVTQPSTAGSGGGSSGSTPVSFTGGPGGGALRLQFSGNPSTLTVNGRLSADGLPGQSNNGGGSGGSLHLTPFILAGTGIISANGGAGDGTAGGGGGGRIAISYTSNWFNGQLTAFGGGGAAAGGAGTIYTRFNSAPVGSVLIDNGFQPGTNTPLSSAFNLPASPFNLTLSGGGSVFALTPLPSLSNLVINAASVLTIRPNETNLFLNVLQNATLAAGGAINVDGKGYARSLGTAPGASYLNKGAGGGNGGAGGNSQSGALGGTNYGSPLQPVLRGSGGGAGANTYLNGCEGGGAIRMTVGGTLTMDGVLSANGNVGMQDDSGGGAGGSIWLTAETLTGTGNIRAEGGDGDFFGGGGGGGGRIAIYSPTNTFTGSLSVTGGDGANAGGLGTIFITTNLTPVLDISGRVTNSAGQGVAGVAVLFQSSVPGTISAITDTNGYYLLVIPQYAYGSIIPSLSTNSFLPGNYYYSYIPTPLANQDFLLVESLTPLITLSGTTNNNLFLNWEGLPGFVYWAESSTNLIDWTIASGNFYGGGSHQAIVPIDTKPAAFFRIRVFY
jgi:hypothetical protein